MQPVLLTLGGQPISSFGLFLLLSFLASSYFIWRVVRAYELDEERAIDLLLLTFSGGLIGARVYFVLLHLNQFDTLSKIVLINRYPGLSFWGGFLVGFLVLKFFAARFKLAFWQLADFALIGLLIGLSISSLGCLLGSCQYGLPSNLPFAVTQVGLIGKRFPLQIIEALVYLVIFYYLYKKSLKFHFTGKIATLGLALLALTKLIIEPFRGDNQNIFNLVSLGYLWSILLFIFAIWAYYKQSKRSLAADLKSFLKVFTDSNKRDLVVLKLRRSWYNFKINRRVTLSKWKKSLFKLLNVKSNPTQF